MNEDVFVERPIIPKDEIQKKLLNILCSNSGECITFGRFTEVLENYFENLDLKYLINPITRIGKPSVNGFVNELIFQKEQYKIYTILKSTIQTTSDNLLYEYIVGNKFINYFTNKFPCFLKTYKLYSYSSKSVYNNLFENKINDSNIIKNNGLISKDFDVNKNNIINSSCVDPSSLCILIQYIETPITLHDFLTEKGKDPYTMNIDLLQILLQIYLPLAKLMKIFTHNDLHTNNILLYKVPNNQYIQMTYQLDSIDIVFKTKYIVKIIDYGRCYFNNKIINYSSKNFYDEIKSMQYYLNCNKLKNVGYKWFHKNIDYKSYYISSLIANPSKDLWTAFIVKQFMYSFVKYEYNNRITPIPISIELFNILKEIKANDEFAGLTLSQINNLCPNPKTHIYSCDVKMLANNLFTLYTKHIKQFNNMQDTHFMETSCLGKMIIDLNLVKDINFQLTYNHIPRTFSSSDEVSLPVEVSIPATEPAEVFTTFSLGGKKKTNKKKKHKKQNKTKQNKKNKKND